MDQIEKIIECNDVLENSRLNLSRKIQALDNFIGSTSWQDGSDRLKTHFCSPASKLLNFIENGGKMPEKLQPHLIADWKSVSVDACGGYLVSKLTKQCKSYKAAYQVLEVLNKRVLKVRQLDFSGISPQIQGVAARDERGGWVIWISEGFHLLDLLQPTSVARYADEVSNSISELIKTLSTGRSIHDRERLVSQLCPLEGSRDRSSDGDRRGSKDIRRERRPREQTGPSSGRGGTHGIVDVEELRANARGKAVNGGTAGGLKAGVDSGVKVAGAGTKDGSSGAADRNKAGAPGAGTKAGTKAAPSSGRGETHGIANVEELRVHARGKGATGGPAGGLNASSNGGVKKADSSSKDKSGGAVDSAKAGSNETGGRCASKQTADAIAGRVFHGVSNSDRSEGYSSEDDFESDDEN
eukprot:gnl/MRDRNA2_/MRDRNA2_28483_c0_seq2.p1 gnl/MRDRNA2_/MRDRNA2_28483_c0~~gnl/MRDRNA2_/MRDRNA2_28483_c0_seq2.p1  ORF type:complete len:428 (+),score=89.46 gnl/MRDRNA2_/MRDRNA2_28483_c0_seq2:51-1286(+)